MEKTKFEATRQDYMEFVAEYGHVWVAEHRFDPPFRVNKETAKRIVENGLSGGKSLGRWLHEMPTESIIKRIECGCILGDDFSENQIRDIPSDILDKYLESGKHLGNLTSKFITSKTLNKYVENGGELRLLTKEQIEAISQTSINKRAENGWDLDGLSDEQIRNIPPESLIKRAKKGAYLYFDRLSEDQLKNIPQEVIIEYAEMGGDLYGLKKERIEAIPQEIINKNIENGGYLDYLTEEQRKNIPLESIILYAVNGGRFYNYQEYAKLLTEEQQRAYAKVPSGSSSNYADAIVLYALGKLDKKDLPENIFGHRGYRNFLWNIIKRKTKKQFNDICKEHGYIDSVPEEVKRAFDEKTKSIYCEIEQRKMDVVKKLQRKLNSTDSTADAAIDEIHKILW